MRPIPIFDTNIFGHVQSGKIPKNDWNRMLRHRPGIGWALSLVTALELLVDLDNLNRDSFTQFRERIDLAFRLANGRILEDPKFLICKDLLRITPPTHLIPPSAEVLSMYLGVIRRAQSLEQLLAGTVKPKRHRPSGLRGTDAPKVIVEDIKKQWISRVENTATALYPDWRMCFDQTGRRLPDEIRNALKQEQDFDVEAINFISELLDWFGSEKKPEVITDLKLRLDAVLKYTLFVVGEFLHRNYSLEKHSSDVFDQFQLHYLAQDGYIIVTNDADMWTRTAGSPQASRIMTFEAFLQSLS